MDRPRIKIKMEPIDIGTELIGILGLILLIGLPLYFYDNLPETIPRHFGVDGEPDGFGGKGMIWILPIIGIIMYMSLFILNNYPHTFNYPQKVTEENAERLYTFGTRMIRTLNAIITSFFAYITYVTIQTALGSQSGLGGWFLPVFLLVTFGIPIYFLYKSKNDKSMG